MFENGRGDKLNEYLNVVLTVIINLNNVKTPQMILESPDCPLLSLHNITAPNFLPQYLFIIFFLKLAIVIRLFLTKTDLLPLQSVQFVCQSSILPKSSELKFTEFHKRIVCVNLPKLRSTERINNTMYYLCPEKYYIEQYIIAMQYNKDCDATWYRTSRPLPPWSHAWRWTPRRFGGCLRFFFLVKFL